MAVSTYGAMMALAWVKGGLNARSGIGATWARLAVSSRARRSPRVSEHQSGEILPFEVYQLPACVGSRLELGISVASSAEGIPHDV